MKYFVRVLEDNFDVLHYYNTKDVVDKDPTGVLYIDFQNESVKVNFDWRMENQMVIREDYYYQGEFDGTKSCIGIELNINQCDDG